ncbi:hypothetical protein [Streptomyces sp. NPDC088360]|uniref:hypothetical protein n=1 Tax=Streptomyces sp. NPDC088360 TaxID=3154515 RepID=UPI00344DB18B
MTGTETKTPSVGDEVMEGKTRAIVTDIRDGFFWLRLPHGGTGTEWLAEDPTRLEVRRTRDEMIEAGDL